MKNTTSFPEKKHFYSSLSEETISDVDYAFAKSVWNRFKCKNLLEYTELYCEIDTILLAEIFQRFRQDMIKFSGLDPARYISLPAFSFDSMLKQTKCELDLPSSVEMVQFIERGIRGGVSFINTRYLNTKARHKNEEIHYIDANNLYGNAQTSMLPYNNYFWLSRKCFETYDWSNICLLYTSPSPRDRG